MATPSQAEVVAAWEPKLRASRIYAKTSQMHAKRAAADGVLETWVNGVLETTKAYKKGDFILHGTEGERYTMAPDKFESRYIMTPEPARTAALAAENFELFTACGRIWAHQLTPTECEAFFPGKTFLAAWGEPMRVEPGDFLAAPYPGGGEVYRIERSAFANTYEVVEAASRWERLRVSGGAVAATGAALMLAVFAARRVRG